MNNHLYDIFKNWGNDIYIYSDPHFGDLESYSLRFPEEYEKLKSEKLVEAEKIPNPLNLLTAIYLGDWVDKLDEMQIKNINSKCGKNATLIILGDIGNIECVKKLKARYKILIMGNHDKGASNYKRVAYSKCFIYKKAKEKWTSFVDRLKSEDKSFVNLESCGENVTAHYDNHLFDEVYEGPLMINDRLILSHEPLIGYGNYMFNIHGHFHNKEYKGDFTHMNVCAEVIDYFPVNLLSLIKKGLLHNIANIHRKTIDYTTERKFNNENKN